MITKNPMQLKAFIKNKAAEKHISAQLVMQNYMLERLLERISLSPYKNNFILKGGFLISAIVGLDTRATMDLDTTIKGFTLTHEAIRKIFTEICAVQIADESNQTVFYLRNINSEHAFIELSDEISGEVLGQADIQSASGNQEIEMTLHKPLSDVKAIIVRIWNHDWDVPRLGEVLLDKITFK